MSKLWAARDRTELAYKRDIAAALSNNDWRRRNDLEDRESYEVSCIDDEIAELETQFLLREAHRLLIGRPTFNEENSRRSHTTGRLILHPDVLASLRTEIRKERADRFAFLLTWLSALTGFVGVLIGLVAVLADKN